MGIVITRSRPKPSSSATAVQFEEDISPEEAARLIDAAEDDAALATAEGMIPSRQLMTSAGVDNSDLTDDKFDAFLRSEVGSRF